jgi:hypothetical protein
LVLGAELFLAEFDSDPEQSSCEVERDVVVEYRGRLDTGGLQDGRRDVDDVVELGADAVIRWSPAF